MEDKGLPAPSGGLSEELQYSNNLQIQKYFTLALLVLLVTNIMAVDHGVGCSWSRGSIMRTVIG